MPAGHPTDYRPEFCEQATNYCLLGATDSELARFFDVTEATINNWKNAHPEFFDAIKEGRESADSKVARSLYKKACGDTEHPADTVAAIFWLKNRRKLNWREKHEIEVTNFEPVILQDENGNKVLTLGMKEKGKSADDKTA